MEHNTWMLHKENKSCCVASLILLSLSLSRNLNSSCHLPWYLFEFFLPPTMVLFSSSLQAFPTLVIFFFSLWTLPTLVLFSFFLRALPTLVLFSLFELFYSNLSLFPWVPPALVLFSLLKLLLLLALVFISFSSSLCLSPFYCLPWSFSLSLWTWAQSQVVTYLSPFFVLFKLELEFKLLLALVLLSVFKLELNFHSLFALILIFLLKFLLLWSFSFSLSSLYNLL